MDITAVRPFKKDPPPFPQLVYQGKRFRVQKVSYLAISKWNLSNAAQHEIPFYLHRSEQEGGGEARGGKVPHGNGVFSEAITELNTQG